MLSAARVRKKTRPQYRVPDAKRAGAIVIEARTKLKDFAERCDGRFVRAEHAETAAAVPVGTAGKVAG